MSLLGIDVGTSGCKAVTFSEEGRQLAVAYEEYDYQHPYPEWAELDTHQVWQKVKDTIKKAVQESAGDPVRALSVSSLGEAVVPVSFNRQILGPSILNFDIRGAEYLNEINEKMSPEYLYRINGNTPGNHYSLTKLLWLKQHQPELYAETDRFLHWGGFVSFMLGADPVVDYTLANRTLLFDLERQDWSDELLGLVNFERDKLPPTVASGTIIGNVASPIADELGLAAGIPIISGGHDQSCNSVGCGVTEPGHAMYGMGTFLCMVPVFNQRPEPALMIAQGLCTEHHVVPGAFVSFIYNQGGSLVKWFRDTFAAAERQQCAANGTDIYNLLTAEMPTGLSRVLALPHFTTTGPPEFIEDSCGVLAGLHLDTPRGEILKGLIESMTFYLRECYEALPATIVISDFRAAGGGSKSDAWMQISADILGQPLQRPIVNEAGALGAAIIAGAGSGIFPSIQAGVDQMVRPGRTFYPSPAMQSQYDERYQRYRRLWPLMADYLRDLAASA